MRKAFAVSLILALVLGISSTSLASTVTESVYEEKAFEVFRDVVIEVDGVRESHWATREIVVAYEAGLLVGYPDLTFRPDARVTGAEFLTMIIRLMGLEETLVSDSTLPEGFLAPSWAISAVAKAAELGLTLPFNTTEPITRDMVAYVLAKALGIDPDPEVSFYLDYHLIDGQYRDYVSALTRAGIFTGFPDRTFGPIATLTRAEAATIMVRALK